MPPKRKAAAASPSTDSEPTPKRSTRAKAVKDSPPAKATKSKASSSKSTKSKSKKAQPEVIQIDSDSDDDEDMIVEQVQPKASSSKSKSASKVKKEKAPAKSKSKSKAALAASLPIDPTPEAPPAAPAPKASPKKKAVSWEEGLEAWFKEFADEENAEMMGGEGIEKLFEEMGVSMEGVAPFLLAWKLNAKPGTFGSFFLSDMKALFREPKINTTFGLKKYLNSVEQELYPKKPTPHSKQQLRALYMFLFPFLKEEGQKSLPGDMAIAVLSIVLAPKYPVAKSFVEYAQSDAVSIKGISPDVWSQLLEFVESVGDDLSRWSEEDAWPSTIDSFVEWRQEQDKKGSA